MLWPVYPDRYYVSPNYLDAGSFMAEAIELQHEMGALVDTSEGSILATCLTLSDHVRDRQSFDSACPF